MVIALGPKGRYAAMKTRSKMKATDQTKQIFWLMMLYIKDEL